MWSWELGKDHRKMPPRSHAVNAINWQMSELRFRLTPCSNSKACWGFTSFDFPTAPSLSLIFFVISKVQKYTGKIYMSEQTIKFRLITMYQDGLVDITEYNKIVNTGDTSFNQWRLNVGREIDKAMYCHSHGCPRRTALLNQSWWSRHSRPATS